MTTVLYLLRICFTSVAPRIAMCHGDLESLTRRNASYMGNKMLSVWAKPQWLVDVCQMLSACLRAVMTARKEASKTEVTRWIKASYVSLQPPISSFPPLSCCFSTASQRKVSISSQFDSVTSYTQGNVVCHRSCSHVTRLSVSVHASGPELTCIQLSFISFLVMTVQ